MKKHDAKLDAFDAWLRRKGLAEMGVARSMLHGIVMLAGDGPVQATHVDEAVKLASESGADAETLSTLQQLGSLLLRFQSEPAESTPGPGPAKRNRRASTADEIAAMLDTYCAVSDPEASSTAATEPAAKPGSAPIDELQLSAELQLRLDAEPSSADAAETDTVRTGGKAAEKAAAAHSKERQGAPKADRPLVSFDAKPAKPSAAKPSADKPERPAQPPPTAEPAAADPSTAEPASSPEGDPEPAEPDPATEDAEPAVSKAAEKRKRPTALILAAALVVPVAAAAVWYLRDSDETPSHHSRAKPHKAKDKPARGSVARLGHVALQATLPSGWRHATGSDSTQPGPLGEEVKTSVLFRGQSPEQPDHGCLVGTTPLPPKLTKNAPLADETLLSIVRVIEASVARRVGNVGDYQAEGCKVASIGGQRTAICAGKAAAAGKSAVLRTYVRLEAQRAIFALFMAEAPAAARSHEADLIFAGLR